MAKVVAFDNHPFVIRCMFIAALVAAWIFSSQTLVQQADAQQEVETIGDAANPLVDQVAEFCINGCDPALEVVPYVDNQMKVDWDSAVIVPFMRPTETIEVQIPQGLYFAVYGILDIQVGLSGFNNEGYFTEVLYALVSRHPIQSIPAPGHTQQIVPEDLAKIHSACVNSGSCDGVTMPTLGGIRSVHEGSYCSFLVPEGTVFIFLDGKSWVFGSGEYFMERCGVTWYFVDERS